jgi:F-type H+-transporting ATPase subunit a
MTTFKHLILVLGLLVAVIGGNSAFAAEAAAPHTSHAAAETSAAAEAEEPAEAELPTFIQVINSIKVGNTTIGHTGLGHFLHLFERQIFSLLATCIFGFIIWKTLGLRSHKPGKMQTLLELAVEGLTNFFVGILGEEHKKHVPFFMSLFLFIWINNLFSIIPLMGPGTSVYVTTGTLAVIVFIYVHFFAIKEGGVGHLLWHLAGSPRDTTGWILAPILFVLEIISTIAKPISLSLRLFGNVMGEDILLGVFLILGIQMAQAFIPHSPIGIPLHIPFLFLALLGGLIQALVFALLSSIYLALLLPHHDDHGHAPDHDEHRLLPAAEQGNEQSGHLDASGGMFIG